MAWVKELFFWIVFCCGTVYAWIQSQPMYEFSASSDFAGEMDDLDVLSKPVSLQLLNTTIHYYEGDILHRKQNKYIQSQDHRDALLVALDQKILPPSPNSLSWHVFYQLPVQEVSMCDEQLEDEIDPEIAGQVFWLRCEYKNLFLGENIWLPIESGDLYENGYRGLFFLGLYDYPNFEIDPDQKIVKSRLNLIDGLKTTIFDAKQGQYTRVFMPLLGTGEHLGLTVEASMDAIFTALVPQITQGQSVPDVYIVGYDGWDESRRNKARHAFQKFSARIESIHGGKILHEKKKVGYFAVVLLLLGFRFTEWVQRREDYPQEHSLKTPLYNWKSLAIWFGFYMGAFGLANDVLDNIFEASMIHRVITFSLLALSPPVMWTYFKEMLPQIPED